MAVNISGATEQIHVGLSEATLKLLSDAQYKSNVTTTRWEEEVYCMEAHLLWATLSWRGLNSIKLEYSHQTANSVKSQRFKPTGSVCQQFM